MVALFYNGQEQTTMLSLQIAGISLASNDNI